MSPSATGRSCRLLVVAAALIVGPAAPAAAQRWEVEFYGGGIIMGKPADGKNQLPAAGAGFTTTANGPSRAVPFFFFGDGTVFFNQVGKAFTSTVVPPITSLDPMLTNAMTHPQTGASWGVRLTRRLTPRAGVEVALGVGTRGLALSSGATAAADATVASFVPAVTAMLKSGALIVSSITANKTVASGTDRELQATGAVIVNLAASGATTPYLVAGAGMVTTTGAGPSVTVVANYRFTINAPGVASAANGPINDTDTVTCTTRPDARSSRSSAAA